jgi:nicotinamide mononucleotide transporter
MNETFYLFGLPATPLEAVSFALSVVTVVLNIRQVHWAWLFSILSSALYGVVFYHARLYGDMGLQGVFIAVSAWGWWQWLSGHGGAGPLKVSHSSGRALLAGGLAWLFAFILLAAFLGTYTNTDVPRIDGFLTAGSLLGQWLLSYKKLENWVVWIIVDVLYVGLYMFKSLYLTAVLYAVFIVLAAIGWVQWRKLAREAA